MREFIDTIPTKVRWLILSPLLLLTFLIVFSLIVPVPDTDAIDAETAAIAPAEAPMRSGPNAVADGMASAVDQLSINTAAARHNLKSASLHSVAATAQTGNAIRSGIADTTAAAAQMVYAGVAYNISSLTYTARSIASSPRTVMSSVLKPAMSTEIPTIVPVASDTAIAQNTLPTASIANQPISVSSSAVWPISGAVTTYFGVPHWPFQPTHTGIDISDGQRSGVTPIKPFKPGRVSEVVQSYYGLGNHVVVDHGGGLTSVYAHMYSTSAVVGQYVDHTSVLGLEGSTGASTGTHLHLEIRQNGVPMDPRLFITGMP